MAGCRNFLDGASTSLLCTAPPFVAPWLLLSRCSYVLSAVIAPTVLARVKASFLEVLEMADWACYDHASWSDILANCDGGLAGMPAEVREYLVERPKAYLNFEEFDYGGAATAGFKVMLTTTTMTMT